MNKGHIYAIMAALGTALSTLVNKMGLSTVPPMIFGTWRSLIVVIGLFMINFFLNKDRKIVIKKSDQNYLLVSGILGALAVTTVFYGQNLTTAINTGFLLCLTPFFVILLAPFMVGEQLTKRHLLSLALMIVGAYFILTGGQLVLFIGDILIVLTALSNAFSDILTRKALFRVPTVDAAYLKNLIVMVLLFLILLIQGFTIPSIDQLFWIVLSGLILVGFWVSLFNAMKEIGASKTALYSNLSPILVVIGSFFLLGESVTLIKLVGGAAILLGAYLIPKD